MSSSDPRDRMAIDYRGPAVVERGNGVRAVYWLEAVGARIRVSRVEVIGEDGRGVSGRDLRSFSPALALEMFEEDLRLALTDPGIAAIQQYMALMAIAHDDADWLTERRRQWQPWDRAVTRLLRDDPPNGVSRRVARLLATSAAYVDALHAGDRSPNASVARRLDISTTRVTEDVRAARREGLLTAAPQRGVPGGELSERAIGLLEMSVPTLVPTSTQTRPDIRGR